MPASPPNGSPAESRLRHFLAETFPEPIGAVSSIAGAPHPLLVLQHRHELAGFALTNGDVRRSFDESYAFFKRLYADRHRAWDDLNVSFVFCLHHRLRELEALCAHIE